MSSVQGPDTRRPTVGIPACRVQRDSFHFHHVGEKYIDAVVDGAGGMPFLIPALAERQDPDDILDRLDGLLVTGSPSNVDPAHYGGPPARADDIADPERDATTLPLIRRAIARAVPVFAICRGIQELNVAFGGTLHQHLHEVDGRIDHRSDKSLTQPERYKPAHDVRLTGEGVLQRLLGAGERITVNSLHGQGIDRLASNLVAEAIADDGTIEAVSVRGARAFALGVQWHPEFRVRDNPISLRLFAAFGRACRSAVPSEVTREHHGSLAARA